MKLDMKNKRELSVVIVNWNAYRYVRACVKSIYAEASDLDLEILVVDNASADGEAARLASELPGVRVIRCDSNGGFAAANNRGYDHASGDYILFLNPDTRIIGRAVQTMLSTFKAVPSPGVVGCKLLNADGTVQKSCVQPFPTIANQILDLECLEGIWKRRKFEADALMSPLAKEQSEVEAVSGACLMIQRDTFQQAGRFDESYFMYGEDVDLCYRVRKLGLRVCSLSNAVVVHYGGGSSKDRKGSEWIAVMQRKAILRFCQNARGQFYGGMYRVAMALAAVCRLLVMAIAFPFVSSAKRRQFACFSAAKWIGVAKWAFGCDGNVDRAGQVG